MAERAHALYDEDRGALLLCMLGQEYLVRRDGVFLRGRKAPDAHACLVLDYLSGPGGPAVITPWRAIGDFSGEASPGFRREVELPLARHAAELISRANTLMPMVDAEPGPSIIGSDAALTVRALPKVYLHLELSRETQDFLAEAWLLFSKNADEFLTLPSLRAVAGLFKDRLLSLLRIY